MRRFVGPFLIVLGVVFTVDLCSHATPSQKQAFSRAVRRTTTYHAVERLVPKHWWDAWTKEWRERTAPALPEDDSGE